MVRAVWNGAVIAESDTVEVASGYTYFPVGTVDDRYLRPSTHRSVCGWKGTASYFDVVVDGVVNAQAAWHYPDPSRRAAPLVGGRIGFWHGVQIERDEHDERPGLVRRLTARFR